MISTQLNGAQSMPPMLRNVHLSPQVVEDAPSPKNAEERSPGRSIPKSPPPQKNKGRREEERKEGEGKGLRTLFHVSQEET